MIHADHCQEPTKQIIFEYHFDRSWNETMRFEGFKIIVKEKWREKEYEDFDQDFIDEYFKCNTPDRLDGCGTSD